MAANEATGHAGTRPGPPFTCASNRSQKIPYPIGHRELDEDREMKTTVGVMPRDSWGEAAEVREFDSAAAAAEFVQGLYDRYDVDAYEHDTQIGMDEEAFRRVYCLSSDEGR